MAIQITLDPTIPQTFYDLNPDHDILTFDYQGPLNVEDNIIWIDGTNDLSKQKHIILDGLKSCQRLLQTYPDEVPADLDPSSNFVTTLYQIAYNRGGEEGNLINGFRSAHQIAAISEDNFVRNFPDDQNIIDKTLARNIYRKAVNIKQRVTLKQSGLKDSTASQYYSATTFNNIQGDLLQYQQSLPDYENMFGNQKMIACDESRSALSPAAYFVDLMHLVDQYIKQAEEAELTLQFRRPDIWKIPLDADHTYTMVPYLEIVNNILKNNLNDRLTENNGIETDSLWTAATQKYPFKLPFHLPLEQIRAYLHHFDIDLATLFLLFETTDISIDREQLGLSLEVFNLLITTDPSEGNIKTIYGINDSKESLDDLETVAVFLNKTDLQISQLEELLFQNFRQKTDIESVNSAVLSLNGSNQNVAIDNLHYGAEDFVEAITIEAWIKTGATDEGIVLSFDRNEYWRLSIKNNGTAAPSVFWGTTAKEGNSKKTDNFYGQIPVADNEWHHIAVSYESGSGKKKIYVDGQLDLETTAHLGNLLGTDIERFGFIGAGSESTFFDEKVNDFGNFNGQISDVRVWAVARKKTDIQADMNRRLIGKEDNLVSYWRLDEGKGIDVFNIITQSNEKLVSQDSWLMDDGLNLPTNEYQPVLFQNLFINKHLQGDQFLTIQKENQESNKIINLDNDTKDRLNRFIRLAQKIEWSFSDLDYILCSIEANSIDEKALHALSQIKALQERTGWPLDLLGSLWSNLKTTGLGNEAKAQTLFDRIFNVPIRGYKPNNSSYHPSSSENPLYWDTILTWHLNDKESKDARQQRKWLQGALKIKEGELTAITNYLFPTEDTIELTVENLSLLHRMAKLPKLLDVSVEDFLLTSTILTSDFPSQGESMINNIEQLIQFSDWLKNTGITIHDWQYLTTGQADEHIQLAYSETDLVPFFGDLNAVAIDWLLKDGTSIIIGGVEEDQAQVIWNRLFNDRHLDVDGILLSKHFQYNGSLWSLFQLQEDSFIGTSISAEESTIAFNWLKEEQYIDGFGNLRPTFNKTTSLDALFIGEEDAAIKQENVRDILLQLHQFYSYFKLRKDTFISDTITLSESEYIFDQLVSNEILYENGTLYENFEESTDLSFLLTKGSTSKKYESKLFISGSNILEVQSLLLQTKDVMTTLGNAISELMFKYYDSQNTGIIEYLSTFFDTKTDLTSSVLTYTVETEDISEMLQLLLSPQSTIDEQSIFMAQIASVFYLSDAIVLSAEELEKILHQPTWFGLHKSDLSTILSTDTLELITTFKALQESLGDTDNLLLQYFENENGQAGKNKALANMTGWEQSQIEYLLNSDYFYIPQSNDPDDVKTADDVLTIYRLNQFFAMAIPIGAEVQFLEELWQLKTLDATTEANWQTLLDLTQSLLNTIRTHYSQEEWIQIFKPIQENLQEKERDALAAWLIWILSEKYAQMRNMDDLYDLLLIDVNMSGCMEVSYIKEAINSVQLYIHRCQMQLETDITNKIPKDWWSWMDEYRLWEANRKIFLYPENYLDPALRKSKTPIFKELEDELMQQQVTDNAVAQGLQNYFDKFADLAHIKIADSYFCKVKNSDSGAEEDTLFLFGGTHSQPKVYYYRTAVLDSITKEVQSWRPWQKIEIPITADYITPVFAFEKLFLFWVETVSNQITVGSDDYNDEEEQTHEKQNADLTKATIKFTFQKPDGSWIPPQNMVADLVINVSPNLMTNNKDYSHEIRKAISINLDLGQTFWKKVQIHHLQEKGTEPERIMVWLGELVRTYTPYPIVPTYSNTGETEQNEFNRMLSESALFAIEAQTANWGSSNGYTSLVPAFLMDSGLLVEQKRVFIPDSTTEQSKIIRRDPGNKRLLEVSSTNLFADNYSHDFLQQGLIGYWPLDGHANDIVGSKHGNNGGGEWVNVNNFPLSSSRSVLELDEKNVVIPAFSGTAGAQFTVEFQVKAKEYNSGNQYLLRLAGMSLDILLEPSNGNLKLSLYGGSVHHSLGSSISTSKWTHIALTFHIDLTSQVLHYSFYRNGTFKKMNIIGLDGFPLIRGTGSLHIGGDSFKGQMADVKYWNTIRTQQQIQDGINSSALLAQTKAQNASLLSVKNHPGLYTFKNENEAFLAIANQEAHLDLSEEYSYEINSNDVLILNPSSRNSVPGNYAFTRLSTNTISKLSQKLLTGEPDKFYQLTSQYLPELPFSRLEPDTNKVSPPATDLLDLNGANQAYFWEIFFHIPSLIANTLNREQKFEEAKKWYEYIFNPFTEAEPTGLIGDWPMNEGGGTRLHEIIDKNNGSLYSGTGNADVSEDNWVLVNDFPETESRSILNLDGSDNSYAVVHEFKGFPSNQLTFECWIKTDDTENDGIIFSYVGEGAGDLNSFVISDYKNIKIGSQETGIAINDGNWHKLTVSWKEGLGWLNIFVDDEEVYFTEIPLGALSDEGKIGIGQDVNSTDESTLFIGQIAEVKVWSAYKAPLDNASLAAYDEPLTEDSLAAYWPMDEGSGSVANNRTSYKGGTYWKTISDFPGLDARPVLHFTGVDPIVVDSFPAYPSTKYTIQGWFNMDEQEANLNQYLIDFGADFQLFHINETLNLKIGDTYLAPDVEWTKNQWYHLSIVFNQINNNQYWNIKMYVDGSMVYDTEQEEGIEIASDQSILAHSGILQFGKDFYGQLADFHFWNIARTAEEILFDYNTHHSSDRFWQFLPFRNHDLEKMEGMIANPREIAAYNTDPFNPHAVARMRIGAYEKNTAMRYIDNLLDWGDYLFAQDNWESIVKASMLYLVSKNLLGSKPESIELLQEPTLKTFDNILEDASLNIPDYQLALEVQVEATNDSINMQNLPYNAFESYFCIPENGDFIDYWNRVEDRLYKIRNCMNIDGVIRSLALFQPPIDPNQLIGALSSGGSLSSLGSVLSTLIPHYRFAFMIKQAKDLTEQLKGLGAAILNALEKKEVQQLELLRASNESAILDMGLMIRTQQIETLKENLKGLNISLEQIKEKEQTYIDKQEEGKSALEVISEAYHISSNLFKGATPFLRIPAIAGYLTPTIFGLAAGGLEPGKGLEVLAEWSDDFSEIATKGAELIDSKIEDVKAEEEWAFQEMLASYDVGQIESQIKSTDLQITIAEQELATQKKSISQAQDMEAFVKDRFTNQELYQWMAGQLSSVYFQTYQLAFDLALSAEKAYQFELNSTDSFIGFGTWDSLQKGLLSGEQLMLRLQQIEKSYTDNNNRQLEIEKTVYLSQLDPLALMELKENGTCTFQLTEKLFDLDYPGHYNRKIKTVGLSVQADVGHYQSIQASLIQNDNRIVLQPDANTVAFLLGEEDTTEPDATQLRSNWRVNQQIAISKESNDNGLFELNFMDERYLPFEGTGALSTWTIQMPKASNRFNFETLSDVMLQLKYTAEAGGEAFREEVTATEALSKESGFRYLSLKEEFSEEWDTFIHAQNNPTFTFIMSDNVIAFNLDAMEIGDENNDIYLFPIPAKYTTMEELLDSGTFSLNDQNWNESKSKVSIDGAQTSPSNWSINVPGSVITEGKLEDIVLLIPYKGNLNWSIE